MKNKFLINKIWNSSNNNNEIKLQLNTLEWNI